MNLRCSIQKPFLGSMDLLKRESFHSFASLGVRCSHLQETWKACTQRNNNLQSATSGVRSTPTVPTLAFQLLLSNCFFCQQSKKPKIRLFITLVSYSRPGIKLGSEPISGLAVRRVKDIQGRRSNSRPVPWILYALQQLILGYSLAQG